MNTIFAQLDLSLLFILMGLAFLASFIDSVVGGGGLITLPALMFAGLPPSSAVATNKLVGTMGSFTSTLMFYRSGKLDLRRMSKLFPLSFIGSLIGAWTVYLIDPTLLKPLMLVMLLVVFIYTLVKKDFGKLKQKPMANRYRYILFLIVILCIGFYDGFLGPGTGSFLIFAFLLAGYDFIHAAGSAKFLNFASNVAALLLFVVLDEVNYLYGIPMGIMGIFGAIIGSKFALKKGSSYVRLLFIVVTFALLAKNAIDYFIG